MCADASQFAYVSDSGTDAADCAVTSPCRTIPYASSKLGSRNQIFIVGASYAAPATIALSNGTLTITSDHAVVTGPDPIVIAGAGAPTNLTLRATTLGTTTNSSKSLIASMGSVSLDDVKIEQPYQVNAGATVTVTNSTIDADGVTAGITTISKSSVHALVTGNGGSVVYDSNRFESTDGRAFTDTNSGTHSTFRNSVFVTHQTSQTVLMFMGAGQVSFCTFVGTQASDGIACNCTTQTGTSNIDDDIFAGMIAPGCSTTYSLFSSGTASGTNTVGSVSTFFANLGGGDFHLATGSPALHHAAAGSSGSDIEGTVRPTPSGSMADVGAYESPN
jgi:hypothetical protein